MGAEAGGGEGDEQKPDEPIAATRACCTGDKTLEKYKDIINGKDDTPHQRKLLLNEINFRKSRIALIPVVLITWIFQVALFFLIWITNKENNFNEIPLPTNEIAFARFISAIMMHVAMTNELKEGMAKMKFSLNHSWRFNHSKIAFLTGFLQTSEVVLVTLLNYYVIIAVSTTVIDIAKDFIALMVISAFDNFFYEEYSDIEISKKLIIEKDDLYETLFTIQTTTSRNGT